MIKNEIWKTVAEKKNILCLPCFEHRLGRRVTLYDLYPCQLTELMFLGAYVGSASKEALPVDEMLLNAVKYKSEPKYEFHQ